MRGHAWHSGLFRRISGFSLGLSQGLKIQPGGPTRPTPNAFQLGQEDQMPKYLTVTEAWRMACACEMNGESMKSLPCQLPHSTTVTVQRGFYQTS